jgi:periplasmic protein TonB
MSYQALLFCPDEKAARVVTQVLSDLEFSVEPCSEPFAAVKKLMAQHFDAIVVDCENEQNATLLFKSARNSGSNQSALAVAVVEGQSGVAKAFRIGANLVLTKPINVEQSKGTLRVARGLLRKADSYKSPVTTPTAATPAAATFKPARPATPTPVAPPAFNGFPAQRTLIEHAVSDATSSAFELQQDPTPAPEPTEVALLESMSDSIASQRSTQPTATSSPSKEYPWQPVSKPLSEPMASSLKRAAAAVGKTEEAVAPIAKSTTPQTGPTDAAKIRPTASSMPSAHGAASAPAPAREVARPTVQTTEAKLAPVAADFSSTGLDAIETEPALQKVSTAPESAEEPLLFSAMQDGQKASGGSKKIFVIGILAMAATAGAYYYTSEHPESAPAFLQKHLNRPAASVPVQTHGPGPAQPEAAAPVQTPAAAPTTVAPAATSDHGSDSDLTNSPVETAETGVVSSRPAPESKPSPAKSVSTPSLNTKAASSVPAPEKKVLTVAKSAPVAKTQTPAPETVQPPAPSVLGVGSGATEKEIAGIASESTSSMPKAVAPETLKISQGVTQGLLIKRVPPAYPPSAKQMHIQGTVQLEASIGKNGSVTNVKALSGDAVLARAAIDAVKQWKYKPYTLNNEPVEIQTQITVNFKLP